MSAPAQLPEISIEQITVDQLDDVVPLFQGYLAHYRYSHDVDDCKAFLTRRLAANASTIFVAYTSIPDSPAEKTPIGFAQLYPVFSSTTLEENWILNDLFVAEAFRSYKIGTSIIQHVLKWADEEKKAYKMFIGTKINNPRAQYLYPKLGFVELYRYDDSISYCYKFQRSKERTYNTYFE